MPAVKGGSYGGVSAIDRLQDRRRRLLDAGLEVIGTEGLTAATVRGVCREAGLSPRFFYESFPSVEELTVALIDEIFERATARVLGAVANAGPEPSQRSRVAIEAFVRELTDDPRVARFTLMEALGSEVLIRRRLALVHSAVAAAIDQKRSMGPARKSGPHREVAAMVLIGGLIELLVAWMHGETGSDLPHIIENYVQLVDDVTATIHGKPD